MDCIVLAGGQVGPDDPLFALSAGRPKALIRLGEQTMLEHVVAALQGAAEVGEVVVVGLDSVEDMRFDRPVHLIADKGDLVSNALAGIGWYRERRAGHAPLLFCTADIPALTSQMVSEHLADCQPFDHYAYYAFVLKERMEERFPGSRRTYIRLRDMKVAGGDMVIIRTELTEVNRSLWDTIAGGRKQPWRIARIVGPGTILQLVLGRLTVQMIESRARHIFDRPVRVLVSPHAELAMDADKPHQVDILRRYLYPDNRDG
jgi:molybdopterin-guanine dinucleotide biosynthesis protein A